MSESERPQNRHLRPIKPGECRNPSGSSHKQRISAAIKKLIREHGLESEFALAAIAMALGKKHLLIKKIKDPVTGKEAWVEQKPEIAWFNAILERTEGKVVSLSDVSMTGKIKIEVVYADLTDAYSDLTPSPFGTENGDGEDETV